MLTCGTYQKRAFFNTENRLNLLLNSIRELAAGYNLDLQAWAIFPNHYHLIVRAPQPENIKRFTRHLHSVTAIAINREDHAQARKVWFQYWESHLTFHRSYLARLNYVHQNPVKHRVVRMASAYPWCSAAWFERKADRAFFKTVCSFPCDQINVPDDFDV